MLRGESNMADEIQAAITAYKADRVSKAFIESSSIALALESQGILPTKGHSEISVNNLGIAEIMAQEKGKAPTQFRAYADAKRGATPDTTNIEGAVVQMDGNRDRREIDITLSPARNETVTF